MKAVQVSHLCFAYADDKPILNDINFNIEAGETMVITGLSGCGKTTLCHILSGIIPHAFKGRLSGQIDIFEQNLADLKLAQIATQVGLAFQDADNQIICTTVEDELAFGLENFCVEPTEIRQRVDKTLADFGFTELREHDPARLSGGQKRLLTIASILILGPRILILDEPMNALDAVGRALINAAITEQRRQGRTVIIVEHDLSLVTDADRCLVLEHGRVAALERMPDLLSSPSRLKELGILV